jgi:hypothetical protein
MKTAMVLIAGVLIASMNVSAANEFARGKYGWTPTVSAPALTGKAAMPRAEQWNRAKFGRVTTVSAHVCAESGCVGTTTAQVSDRDARMMEKYGRALPVVVDAACGHDCCQRGE